MKKGTLALAGLLLGFLVAVTWGGLAKRYPYADLPIMHNARLVEAETAWYAAGIQNYRVLVSIEFSTERRLNEILVTGGAVREAKSAPWDAEAGDWGEFVPLPVEQAEFFTISGLFDLVRSALQNEEVPREEIRMSTGGTPPVPQLIYLSMVLQDEEAVDGTALVIEVLEFEVLP